MPTPAYIFSVDLEEWFHILELDSSPDLDAWSRLENRVEKNIDHLLGWLNETGTFATFFTLGWVAERYPAMIKKINKEGHELASHGYAHRLIFSQTPEEFFQDISRAKKTIEDLTGKKVTGYRAPGFSVTPTTLWALDEIKRAGFEYDASIFPGNHGHGGIPNSPMGPHVRRTRHGELYEFPVTLANLLGKRICFSGGGYLRLFPYFLIQKLFQGLQSENRVGILYIHPREIDPTHPRLEMNWMRRFKCYVNLDTTEMKLKNYLRDFSPVCFRDYLTAHARELEKIA